jgi:hypothetical protein
LGDRKETQTSLRRRILTDFHVEKSRIMDVMVHTLIPAMRKLRQEDLEFKVSMGYIARPCLKNKQK